MLIEASRILDSQFNKIGLELTGAQVELLRNATMLFHEQDMFVETYHDGYYLNASDADYDVILSIVAELERKLMGNDNVIFSYNDRHLERWYSIDHAPGMQLLETMPVPAGYVYVIEEISVLQVVTGGSYQHLRVSDDVDFVYLDYWDDILAGIPNTRHTRVTLKEDDYIRATFGSTANDEHIELAVWGYKMKVPE